MIFSHSALPPSDVAYIHFLDSDDMLSLDCIEQCINSIGKCDIVWHDVLGVYEDNIPQSKQESLLEMLSISEQEAQNQSFSALELWKNMEGFSWVAVGIFHISLLEYLRFSPQIQSEDGLFGMLLFAKARQIKILPKSLYIYRVRANSTSEHKLDFDTRPKPYAPYLSDIAFALQNPYKIKHYHFSYSCAYICLGLLAYIRILDKTETELKQKIIAFLQTRAIYAFGGVRFESDPKHIRELLEPLKPYMQKMKLGGKIAYFFPRVFGFLRFVKRSVRSSKPS